MDLLKSNMHVDILETWSFNKGTLPAFRDLRFDVFGTVDTTRLQKNLMMKKRNTPYTHDSVVMRFRVTITPRIPKP